MFRIRRIYDDVLPVNRGALARVKEMLKEHFPAAPEADVTGLEEKLKNPFKMRFSTVIYVAERRARHTEGFAVVLRDPELRFGFLEYLAAERQLTSRGIGGALYDHVRDEERHAGARGLLYECLPDDPAQVSDPKLLEQNQARLRFYERWGARPIVGTAYEAPLKPGDTGYPHLLWDDLGSGEGLRREWLKKVVRAVLERKYGYLCPPEYVKLVVDSIKDDPVQLRPLRYARPKPKERPASALRKERSIALVVNDRHDIHHVRERGYVEAPVRIASILGELERSGLFEKKEPHEYPARHIKEVHAPDFVDYLRKICGDLPAEKSVYPYVFPIRNATRPPKELSVRAGYFCIDTFTPLNKNAHLAAKRAVDCALTAADELLEGRHLAYALVRPPGHHAERRAFGGFCYFNNNAIAAHYLSRYGRVAILDVDYHHGNGQQDIFYARRDVFTASIHGHPNFAYPYFTGFADELGEGEGEGFNLNQPLAETIDGPKYRRALAGVLEVLAAFRPTFLVLALGLDTAKGDPTGSWLLSAKDFTENGRMIGALGLPTLVVQEGGYRTRSLGVNARHFFEGLVEGARKR